jgi:hypothetical protein
MATPTKSRSKAVPASRKTANAGPKPQHHVVEDMLHWQTKAGDELVLDLDFPSDILRKVMLTELDDQEQFEAMLEALGDESLRERVNKLGSLEYMRLIKTFFDEFSRAAGVEPGESGDSSS